MTKSWIILTALLSLTWLHLGPRTWLDLRQRHGPCSAFASVDSVSFASDHENAVALRLLPYMGKEKRSYGITNEWFFCLSRGFGLRLNLFYEPGYVFSAMVNLRPCFRKLCRHRRTKCYHSNAGVKVAVLVLQPRRQTNTFPWCFERGATCPDGNSFRNSVIPTIRALPLIDVKGLRSKEGVM